MFNAICWLIAMVVLLLFELATVALTTIWFAAGALVASIVSLFCDKLIVQVLVFIFVSIGILVLLRPSMVRKFNEKTNKTNIDEWIGKRVRIIEKVDNNAATGCAVLNGQEWTARAQDDSVTFDVGDMATIANISGVKLILTK
ncbi:MAG: NfeD family protein [Lachnospiraceae bacterium]|nr:NfeD family protein [Lachnospiraceae bacterium]